MDSRLLDPTPQDKLQLPYMKLPKVHKLDKPASNDNLNKLTGRPIITAHSWITSNPSRLLGTELDNIILQLKKKQKTKKPKNSRSSSNLCGRIRCGMESLMKGFPKSPLQEWVRWGGRMCVYKSVVCIKTKLVNS